MSEVAALRRPTAADTPNFGQAAALLQVEHLLRQADGRAALRFQIVNELRSVLAYTQAVLLEGDTPAALKVRAAANLPVVDRTAPGLAWLERVAVALAPRTLAGVPTPVRRGELPLPLSREWDDFCPPQGLWVPLHAPRGGLQGALWLTRKEPFDQAALAALAHVAEACAHALWQERAGGAAGRAHWLPGRRGAWMAAAALAAAMLLPVPLTALAPSEVDAAAPSVVTAPRDGVIAEVTVEPNQRVRRGELLLRMEARELASRLAVAEQELAVAEAEYHKVRQAAFVDSRSNAELAELEARVGLRRAERDFAASELARTEVRADADGVVLLRDSDDWKGRPVRVGERVLALADPERVELVAWLPASDAIALEPGTPVTFFPDADPLNSLAGRVEHTAYAPAPAPDGVLAFRLVASFETQGPTPRLGQRGTAKVHGEQVRLFYYLFRRPITVLRQWLGL